LPRLQVLIPVITLTLVSQPALAGTAIAKQSPFIKALDAMMVQLTAQTAKAAATVKKEYRAYLDLLVLDEYASLQDALYAGGLVPLPGEPEHFNLRVRTDGPAPIAEKDLDNQATYISARPATIGALLEIASQVKSGPLEITSLVRHTEYQDDLRTSNANAYTSVPMHTMGLAFDIALVNTPLERVYEIRDVLSRMQAAGDLLVVGERKQLVFHVVPHPSRLGYFTEAYARAAAAAIAGGGFVSTPMKTALTPYARPVVSTEIVGFRPTDEIADAWWAAEGTHSDLTVEVSAPSTDEHLWFVSRLTARCVEFVTGLLSSARDAITL
jgi:Family of unknown function (DUF5715)